MTASNIKDEVDQRNRAIAHGGIGLMHMLVRKVGLIRNIDARAHVLKIHAPYHESDHVLNIAYNALCNGVTPDDIEIRRNNSAHLDALGTESIPDPTTAGDFCRRFNEPELLALMEAINESRIEVWRRQPAEFLELARIDGDGTMVGTLGECKQGMDISRSTAKSSQAAGFL